MTQHAARSALPLRREPRDRVGGARLPVTVGLGLALLLLAVALADLAGLRASAGRLLPEAWHHATPLLGLDGQVYEAPPPARRPAGDGDRVRW